MRQLVLASMFAAMSKSDVLGKSVIEPTHVAETKEQKASSEAFTRGPA
jgi:hypothetical protein